MEWGLEQNIYETLVWWNGSSTTDLIPMLATEIPTVQNGGIIDNGTTYVFHLRPNVRFHDGTLLDAYDVEYSLERVLRLNYKGGPAWMLGQFMIPDFYNTTKDHTQDIADSVEVVDDLTLTVHLIKPYSPFLQILASPPSSIISMEYINANEPDVPGVRNSWMANHTCGTGPFYLDNGLIGKWTDTINLERFDQYHGKPSKLTGVDVAYFDYAADFDTVKSRLENGTVNIVLSPPVAQYQALTDLVGVTTFDEMPNYQVTMAGFNQQIASSALGYGNVTSTFFSDVNVRKAFSFCFDYDYYINITKLGNAERVNGILPEGIFGYNASIPYYHYNLTAAASYLAMAFGPSNVSWADSGFTLNLYYNNGNLYRQGLLENLKQGLEQLHPLGLVSGEIIVNVVGVDWTTYLGMYNNHQLPLRFMGWAPDYADADDYLQYHLHVNGGGAHFLSLNDPAISDMIDLASIEQNDSMRLALLANISFMAEENAYYLYLDQGQTFHVQSANLSGYVYNPMYGNDAYFYPLSNDDIAPTIQITDPSLTPSYQNTYSIDISGLADDDRALETIIWSWSMGNFTSTGTVTPLYSVDTKDYSWTISDLYLFYGTNVITITAKDMAGNTVTTTQTVIVDDVVPEITITSPSDDYLTINTSPIALAGGVSDEYGIGSMTWSNSIDGSVGAIHFNETTHEWTANSFDLGLGTNVISITAVDHAGNSVTKKVIVNYDNGSPDVKLISPSSWSFNTVNSTVDISGTIYDPLGYRSIDWNNLATGANGTITTPWTFKSVDTSGWSGSYSSIAQDSQGGIHISYYDGAAQDLKYAYRVNGSTTWTIETVDYDGVTGLFTSIALAPDGVHILYYEADSPAVKHAYRSLGDSIWTLEVIEYGAASDYNSLAVDKDGDLYAAYWIYDTLRIGWKPSGSSIWYMMGGVYIDQYLPNRGCSLAVDQNDKVHVSFFDAVESDLKYVTNKGGSWTVETVDDTINVGMYSSLAVDVNGNVHIAYLNANNGSLDYASRDAISNKWTIRTLDASGNVYGPPSLSLGATGSIYISYLDESSRYLNLAYNVDGTDYWALERISDAQTIDPEATFLQGALKVSAPDRPDDVRVMVTFGTYISGSSVTLNFASKEMNRWSVDGIDLAMGLNPISIYATDSAHNNHSYLLQITRDSVPTVQTWTWIVYMDGDNNLEQQGINDFLEMAKVGSDQNLKIVVLFDRIPGYSNEYGDWNGTKLFIVNQSMTPTEGNAFADLGEVDMGDWHTLYDFLNMSTSLFPADNYALVLWDHGAGYRGLCQDDTSSNGTQTSYLKVNEVAQALDQLALVAGKRISLVGMDACQMGSIEVAYELRHSTDYIVYSEELVPYSGWPYDGILSWLKANPSSTASQLGYVIVDEFMAYYGEDDQQCISCVDCSKIAALKVAFDELTSSLIDNVYTGDYLEDIIVSRSSSEEFPMSLTASDQYNIDLLDFLWEMVQRVPDGDLKLKATALMNAVNNTVLFEGHGNLHLEAFGMSIYFPKSYSIIDATEASYMANLEFNADTRWMDLLSMIWGGSQVPGVPTNPRATPSSSTIELTWNVPSSHGSVITSYNIYRSTSSGTETLFDTVSENSYIDADVTLGGQYYYVVTAVNDVGESFASLETFTTLTESSNYPHDLRVVSLGDGNISLAWDGPDDGLVTDGAYRVTYSYLSLGNLVTKWTDTDLTALTIEDLKLGRYYTFSVQVFSPTTGFSATSNEISGNMPGMSYISPPSLESANVGDEIEITWSCPDILIDNGTAMAPQFGPVDIILIYEDYCILLEGDHDNSDGNRYFTWTVPSDITSGTYRLGVVSENYPWAFIVSGEINVINTSPPEIIVTSPTSGMVNGGNDIDITWTAKNFTGDVAIVLESFDYADLLTVVDASVGIYSWPGNVSLPSRCDYVVYVCSLEHPWVQGASDVFSLRNGLIVTNPSYDTNWLTGETVSIDWMNEVPGGFVDIDLWTYNDEWIRIASSVPNDDVNGHATWQIDRSFLVDNGLEQLGAYRVRVTSTDGSSDISDEFVTIGSRLYSTWPYRNPDCPAFNISGGWTYRITWETMFDDDPTGHLIDVGLYQANGEFILNIAHSIPASDYSINWTVPFMTEGVDYYLEYRDSVTGEVWDRSSNFQIANEPVPLSNIMQRVSSLVTGQVINDGAISSEFGKQSNIYNKLGNLYNKQGNLYNKLGNLYNKQGNLYNKVASIYGNLGDIYGDSSDLFGEDTSIFGKQGNLYNKQGNLYNKLGNLYNKQGNLYNKLGNLYNKQGNLYNKLGPFINIDGRLSEIRGRNSNLYNKLSDLYVEMADVNKDMASVYGKNSNLYNKLSNLYSKFDNIGGKDAAINYDQLAVGGFPDLYLIEQNLVCPELFTLEPYTLNNNQNGLFIGDIRITLISSGVEYVILDGLPSDGKMMFVMPLLPEGMATLRVGTVTDPAIFVDYAVHVMSGHSAAVPYSVNVVPGDSKVMISIEVLETDTGRYAVYRLTPIDNQVAPTVEGSVMDISGAFALEDGLADVFPGYFITKIGELSASNLNLLDLGVENGVKYLYSVAKVLDAGETNELVMREVEPGTGVASTLLASLHMFPSYGSTATMFTFDVTDSIADRYVLDELEVFWNFGDGETRDWSSDFVVSHFYAFPREYNAWVEIRDPDGQTVIATHKVLVNDEPYTQIEVDSQPNENGWYTSLPSINMQAWDALGNSVGSGISVMYAWDDGNGGPLTWMQYQGTIPVPGEGRWVLHYYAVSDMEYQEDERTREFLVDLQGPVISYRIEQASWDGWYKGPVSVHFTATDPLSGVDITSWSRIVNGNGAVTVIESAYDMAGNSAVSEFVLHIDSSGPLITHSISQPQIGGWYKGPVLVHYTVTDPQSGVELSSWDRTVTGNGEVTVTESASDRAGNIATETFDISIDSIKPVTTLNVVGGGPNPGEIRMSSTLTITSLDQGSGISLMKYSFDNSPWVTTTGPIVLPGVGTHTLYYYAIDKVGNVESEWSVTYQIVMGETSIEYTGATNGEYSDAVRLSAQLTSQEILPSTGIYVTFTIYGEWGSQTVTVMADANGFAFADIELTLAAGAYAVEASFTGTYWLKACSDTDVFNVMKETETVESTGNSIVMSTSSTILLMATITSLDGTPGDLSHISVIFKIFDPASLTMPLYEWSPMNVQATTTPGVGTVTLSIARNLLAEGSFFVVVEVNGHNFYQDMISRRMSLTVCSATGTFVTGGGIINDGGAQGSFGFVARTDNKGVPQGDMVYIYYQGDWGYMVTSTKITGLGFDSSHAFFEGICKVTRFDPTTGAIAQEMGLFKYRVDCWDNSDKALNDAFQISIYTMTGVKFHDVGGQGPSGYLLGGNITIHRKK